MTLWDRWNVWVDSTDATLREILIKLDLLHLQGKLLVRDIICGSTPVFLESLARI